MQSMKQLNSADLNYVRLKSNTQQKFVLTSGFLQVIKCLKVKFSGPLKLITALVLFKDITKYLQFHLELLEWKSYSTGPR